MIKRCLVTGHRGYIGSRLYKALCAREDCEVLGIDRDDLDGNEIISLFTHDIVKREKLYSFSPDYIFHLAAIPRVGESIENPLSTMHNNVIAGSVMLDFARNVKAKRFIYSSSSSVKGDKGLPISPYALQKYTTELETQIYSNIYGIDTVSLRYFNVYSADQPAEGAYATAISNWMRYIRNGQIPFITGNGEQRRDMLHVSDAVSANIFAMESLDDFKGAAFDVGTGKNISLNEVAQIVLQYFPEIKFDYTEDRLGDVKETLAETQSLEKLGWQTKINLEDGIHQCFKKLKKELENES
jgi:UDP-glucose 4-epimerase